MRREGKERATPGAVLAAFGKCAAYLALFLGMQLLVSSIYSAHLSAELMLRYPTEDFYAFYDLLYNALLAKTMEISLVASLLTLGTVTIFFKARHKSLRQELLLRPVSGRLLGWCAALAFCLYWFVSLVLSALPADVLADYMVAAEGLDDTGVVAFLAAGIVAPIVEEVIFRGLIFTRLNRVMSGMAAAVLSAAVFGWCHGQFIWFCYAFVLGLIFGYLTHATGSVLPAMVMHLVFNLTNELMAMTGEWEPGFLFSVLILAAGTVGMAFCAARMRAALQRATVPAAGETPKTPAQPPIPDAVADPRPSRAVWDADSGAEHRFPPQLR